MANILVRAVDVRVPWAEDGAPKLPRLLYKGAGSKAKAKDRGVRETGSIDAFFLSSFAVKSYGASDIEAFVDACVQPGIRFNYEVIRGPCHLFADVEWNLPDDRDERMTIGGLVDTLVTEARKVLRLPVERVALLCATTKKKVSWHVLIVMKGAMFASNGEVGAFLDVIVPEIYRDIIDGSVYSNERLMRCAGQMKEEKNNPLIEVPWPFGSEPQMFSRDTVRRNLITLPQDDVRYLVTVGSAPIAAAPMTPHARALPKLGPIGKSHAARTPQTPSATAMPLPADLEIEFRSICERVAQWLRAQPVRIYGPPFDLVTRTAVVGMYDHFCPIEEREHRHNNTFFVLHPDEAMLEWRCYKCSQERGGISMQVDDEVLRDELLEFGARVPRPKVPVSEIALPAVEKKEALPRVMRHMSMMPIRMDDRAGILTRMAIARALKDAPRELVEEWIACEDSQHTTQLRQLVNAARIAPEPMDPFAIALIAELSALARE